MNNVQFFQRGGVLKCTLRNHPDFVVIHMQVLQEETIFEKSTWPRRNLILVGVQP